MDVAPIKAEGLGKCYRIADVKIRDRSQMLQTEIANWVKRRLRLKAKNDLLKDFWALRDVSFEVQQGEVLGLIGHNGAGKSTLLKVLCRITDPTTGKAALRGRVGSMLEVGTGFHPELTGRENIFLNGAILGMRRHEILRKFDEIVAFSGVEGFLETPVKRFSSGMYVRLAFAIAAHLEPEVLLVDEVLAVGDVAFRRKCLGQMDQVARAGRTIMFVSHNMAAIQNLCHRVAFIKHGQIDFIGEPQDAIERYLQSWEDSTIDLSVREDRKGTGALRVVGLSIRDTDGRPLDSVSSGEDIEICLDFECTEPLSDQDLRVELRCRTPFNSPVFLHHNELGGDTFGTLPTRGTFVFRLGHVPLPPSLYRLGFTVSSPSGPIDGIEEAGELSVISGDYYETGMIPSAQVASCLVDGSWRVECKDDETNVASKR